ncbi:sterol desaturase [Penicillium coprophilum]|uniref:sterol desaturase n=1 Tax=Penicillium coprophilum TaxID=36646 RepID=UPI00238EE886|nr:sterol desaturase [Penicillium coprophilum]KAJ5154407.1 sterol desaturase [Penicillium coprophilum]
MDPIVPSLKTFIVDFAFGLLAREVSFYYVHRALHHPSIYVYIHKMHHKYITPVAFAAEYAHPVEHLFANVLPITLPLYLKGAHFLSITAFGIFELWEAAADHSGYDFLKLPPAELHDLHHEKFRVNYGTIGLMDWIHGTDVVGWDRPEAKKVKITE